MAHKNRENHSPWKERQKRRGETARRLQGRHRKPTENFNFQQADDRIYDIFRHHGFAQFPHSQRQQLTHFYQLLSANQKVQNFTRLLKLRDIAIKHFIDSLMVGQLTQLRGPLLDLGTGPGFPGIPLKIAHPELKILLAEGVQIRVEFLKSVRDQLKLSGLDIFGRNINQDFVYPVQGVITRAVEDIRNTLGNVLHCLQTNGRVYFMKGPQVDPEIPVAQSAWREYYALEDDIAYTLPNTPHQRRLLIYRKIKSPPLPDDIL